MHHSRDLVPPLATARRPRAPGTLTTSSAARLQDSTSKPSRPYSSEVQNALREWDGYWTTLAPYGEEAEDAVIFTLGDDLADIWRDLKQGLLALEDGAAPEDVVWEWRFGFYSHWGRHATEALRALHARLADQGGPVTKR